MKCLLSLSLVIAIVVVAVNAGKTRIIGGQDAVQGQFPSLVYILSGTEFCGGTVIGNQWVLTAAHCVKNINTNAVTRPSNVQVTVGNVDRTRGSVVNVDKYWVHPTYDNSVTPRSANVDLAVLHTTSDMLAVAGVQTIQMVTLANRATCESTGVQYVVAGWGNTNAPVGGSTSGTPNVARWVPQVFGDRTTCNTAYVNSGQGSLPSHMFCASSIPASAGGKDSCFGDSGGPLLLNVSNTWLQCGIVNGGTSTNPQCAQANQFGTYNSLAQFQQYVLSIVNGTTTEVPISASLVVPSALLLVAILLSILL